MFALLKVLLSCAVAFMVGLVFVMVDIGFGDMELTVGLVVSLTVILTVATLLPAAPSEAL